MVRWFRMLLIPLVVVPVLGFAPAPATAQGVPAPSGDCAFYGFAADSEEEEEELQRQIRRHWTPPERRPGAPPTAIGELPGARPLRPGQEWRIPDGSRPLVAVDPGGPISGYGLRVAVAGADFRATDGTFDEPRNAHLVVVDLPHLGPTVRSLGLIVRAGGCELDVAVLVDRSAVSTRVGTWALVATILFGLATVVVAWLRRRGWLARYLLTVPFGLLAGIAFGVVLLEAAVVSPLDWYPWWAPVSGLAYAAAVLPVAKLRLHRAPPPGPPAGVPTAPPPTGTPTAPMPAAAPPAVPPPGPPGAYGWQPTVLGGYLLEEPVARTGVAGVYRARRLDPATGWPAGEPVLSKVVLPGSYRDPVARQRLRREAEALTGVTHPHLLRLREEVPVGDPADPGPPMLVFDDAAVPLRAHLAGRALTGPQVAHLVIGVLAGLQAVHERGLVHRDIRPETVWLDRSGLVVLGGFELAVPGGEHPLDPAGVDPYASPEQRAGRALDGRADLWSAALMLGELLTGQLPLPPGWGAMPAPFANLLARALAADPDARPASAADFSHALRAAADQAFGPGWSAGPG